MSGDAASLPCPICAHTGIFNTVQSLRDRLIAVSTNKILCPVCQDEVSGLDKLTIHLFSHVKLVSRNETLDKADTKDTKPKSKSDNPGAVKTQLKKTKPPTAKNKTTAAPNMPVKFVKIYPKLPVISLNPVPVIDISRNRALEEVVQASTSIYMPAVKSETSLTKTNTTCNVCGLNFVDANILRMHRCLIHNIDENSNVNSTRYHCHLCPKNFKMRGSLMVHLRVAHFGFSSVANSSETSASKITDGKSNELSDEKSANLERNDNKQWQCDVCRKCFTTKYFLKKHKRLHTGETPYACTQCNKTFTFQQSYHKHLLYHNDEKPHICTYCGRAFKELSTLHNHQRIHTGEKPFSCETCGKCFRQRVSYLVHRRIHTGVMPYKCTACDKSFRYKVSQRTHKCQAQPPGTVVRQAGDLVEKLKKKYAEPDDTSSEIQVSSNHKIVDSAANDYETVPYTEVSEANAELVRRGAELSLEDMESESFSLISEVFNVNNNEQIPSTRCSPNVSSQVGEQPSSELFNSNINDLIDAIPVVDKSVPSPSEILKNLCLSNDEDYEEILQNIDINNRKACNEKEFNIFL